VRAVSAALLLSIATAAPAAEEIAVRGAATPGGLLIVSVPAGSRLAADGTLQVPAPDGRYLIGLPRDRTAPLELEARGPAGAVSRTTLKLAPRTWRVQRLPALGTTDTPSPEWQAQRAAERGRIEAAKAAAAAQPAGAFGWAQPFLRPAGGRVTGVYGSQRVFGGLPRPPHWGLDIANATGTPVIAPADGVVRLSDGPFLLEGNIVLVDHGAGLVSSYMHLSERLVKAGDKVKQGQRLGRIGTTGRSTGPHLHWGLSLMKPSPGGGAVEEVRLDPALRLGSD
jgi:murein DD-endopeptidase MepM/ murein hydrolase activator NlpD